MPVSRASDPPGAALRGDRKRLELVAELLDDESPAVQAEIRRLLDEAGKSARPHLARAARDPRPRLRARARELLLSQERRRALRRLLRYAMNPHVDLERGLWILSGLDREGFDARPYVRALDAMAAEVGRRIALERDELARPVAMVQYLSQEIGFTGDEDEFDHPDNVFLHRAIERRRGMPLTLCALYLFVARRVGIRAGILPLPGHVMLRLYAGQRSLIVDPFHEGKLRTRADCLKYMARQGRVPTPDSFRDASDAAMFQRHLLNLMSSYHGRARTSEGRSLHRVAAIVGRVQIAHAQRTA